jgi:ATP-dependent DNA helicase RecQ
MEVDFALAEAAAKLGYFDLKVEQKDVIKQFVNGNDVFVCLPTGYGKSLCYCCLPILYDLLEGQSSPWSTIIVISPLVALMSDQVRSLNDRRVSAIKIVNCSENQCSNSRDHDELRSLIINGRYQIIFTTLELLLTDKDWSDVFQSSTFCCRLVGLIVDEAHCVKKW